LGETRTTNVEYKIIFEELRLKKIA